MFKLQKIIDTPHHRLKLDFLYDFISMKDIPSDKELFYDMCKKGCKNFNNKFSCPPFSPKISSYVSSYDSALIVLLKIDLSQLDCYGDYLRLKVGNAVIKPRIERIMRKLEERIGGRFLSTGACRLCKPCQRKMNLPCKNPKKMRYSLESLGVDCNKLSEKIFDLPLLWYKDKTAPKYTSVICGLAFNDQDRTRILTEFLNFVENS